MTPTSISQTIRGVIPALPVPLSEGGEVDVQGLQRLVRYVIDEGVHGLWVLGSSGEFTAFSAEERRLIVDVTVKEVSGRIPVVVGVGDNDVRKAIRSADEARALGADACFVVLPFYFTLDAREGIRFFREFAAAAPLPVILYDNPFATKVKLDPTVFLELADAPNIIGFKDSSSDFIRFQNLLLGVRSATSWKILQGDERLIGASLLWGADGAVAALASIAPNLFVKLYEAARTGNAAGILLLQERILRLSKLFEIKGESTDGAFFAGLKAALQVLGICGRAVASPFCSMPEEKMANVESLLRECGIHPSGKGDVRTPLAVRT